MGSAPLKSQEPTELGLGHSVRSGKFGLQIRPLREPIGGAEPIQTDPKQMETYRVRRNNTATTIRSYLQDNYKREQNTIFVLRRTQTTLKEHSPHHQKSPLLENQRKN
jgi:hypothetical protein